MSIREHKAHHNAALQGIQHFSWFVRKASWTLAAIVCLFLGAGCSTVHKYGRTNEQLSKTDTKLAAIEKKKQEEVAKLIFAADYALHRSNGVPVALRTITQAMPLLPTPSEADQRQARSMVEAALTNNYQPLIQEGQRGIHLKQQSEELQREHDRLVEDLLVLAQEMARRLTEYEGAFGLNAIFMGLKTLFSWMFLAIGGLLLVFVLFAIIPIIFPVAGFIFAGVRRLVGVLLKNIKPSAKQAAAAEPDGPLEPYRVPVVLDLLVQKKVVDETPVDDPAKHVVAKPAAAAEPDGPLEPYRVPVVLDLVVQKKVVGETPVDDPAKHVAAKAA